MSTKFVPQPFVPPFVTRLAALLAATDQFVCWWGAHRAWPASEWNAPSL
jgi:hypothetical protein